MSCICGVKSHGARPKHRKLYGTLKEIPHIGVQRVETDDHKNFYLSGPCFSQDTKVGDRVELTYVRFSPAWGEWVGRKVKS